MTIKELRAYLDSFPDGAQVAVGAWFGDVGRVYYRPHTPCSPPVILEDKFGTVAVVGFFDDCLADTIEPLLKIGR